MASVESLVAIVDDDPAVCRAMARLLRSLGVGAKVYSSGEALVADLAEGMPDRVLLDLHLPGLRGPDLIAALGACGLAPSRIVVMTGLDRPGAREACLRAGVAGYTTKPVPAAEIVAFLAGG